MATYELGTRQCSVVRLVELCVAMDELPHDLLAKVHSRVFADPLPEGMVQLDVAALLNDPHEDGPLAPLHRWARGRVAPDADPAEVELLTLGPDTVESLAQLCGLSASELRRRLGPYGFAGSQEGNSGD